MVSALIGAGFMGDVHSRALKSAGIEIAGIISSSPEKSNQAAELFGISRAYQSIEELLGDSKVTVVHVLTPNHSHAKYVSMALEAGKHVVCEKPLTVDAAESIALTKRSQELGLIGAIPFAYRFHAMAREARSKVVSGELGKIFSVRGQYLQDWLLNPEDTNWRVDSTLGGQSRAFADIGIHLCDLVEFISNKRIVRLVASTRTVYPNRAGQQVATEDVVSLMAEMEDGIVASLLVSQVAAGHKNGLVVEIHGANQALSFEQERPETLWIGRQGANLIQSRDPANLSNEAARITRLPAGHLEGYLDAFTSFMRDVRQAVQGETPPGLPTFADAARGAVLTECVIQSAKSGVWVDVPSF